MKKIFLSIFLITFFLSGCNIFSKDDSSEKKSSSEILDEVPTGELYYFYSDSCHHCSNVNTYFLENDIYKKYAISKFEVSEKGVAEKFYSFVEKYNVPKEDRGAVPFIISREKYWIGDQTIIDAHKNGEFEIAKKM